MPIDRFSSLSMTSGLSNKVAQLEFNTLQEMRLHVAQYLIFCNMFFIIDLLFQQLLLLGMFLPNYEDNPRALHSRVDVPKNYLQFSFLHMVKKHRLYERSGHSCGLPFWSLKYGIWPSPSCFSLMLCSDYRWQSNKLWRHSTLNKSAKVSRDWITFGGIYKWPYEEIQLFSLLH